MDTHNHKKYWETKIAAFLHDPFDKIMKVKTHESRARKIADAVGVSHLSKDDIKRADIVASGLDRANLPSYSRNEKESGAIDFTQSLVITHAINPYTLSWPKECMARADIETDKILDVIEEDTGKTYDRWSRDKYFNYLVFGLRKKLQLYDEHLGFLWDHIPADSRIPDHSIWNHCQLTSALKSCYDTSDQNDAALVVFSISPVQPFISKARKLRDYWTASVLLSWLAFEGVKAVMEQLGPDHVLYPSLHDQPLVEEYLHLRYDDPHGVEGAFSFKELFEAYKNKAKIEKPAAIASFPNKFVFVAPLGSEQRICEQIKESISTSWCSLANAVKNKAITFGASDDNGVFNTIFERQTAHYWSFSWSSCRFITTNERSDISQLFGDEKYKDLMHTVDAFAESYKGAASGVNSVYGITHATAQSLLAASKTKPTHVRPEEPGEKCPICGEMEVLHDFEDYQDYNTRIREYWSKIENGSRGNIKQKEKLCAVCAIKRFTPSLFTAKQEVAENLQILDAVFAQGESFESTGEMAFSEFSTRVEQKYHTKIDKKVIDEIQDNEDNETPGRVLHKHYGKNVAAEFREADKYYAILMMDGDKMGELVNGEHINTTWKDVIHPDLVERISDTSHIAHKLWKEHLDKNRMLAPMLHAKISEALGFFSLYAVPYVIKKWNGRLIYAGGDDVCAVLPLSNVIHAADEIRHLYNSAYMSVVDGEVTSLDMETDSIDPQRPLFQMLGKGKGISVSAGVLICHYKQPLRGALEETHTILDSLAKKHAGRDAFALRLKKRSGQHRDFYAQWDKRGISNKQTVLQQFLEIQRDISADVLSTSLLYRLVNLKDGITAILDNGDNRPTEEQLTQAKKLMAYDIAHSSKSLERNKSIIAEKLLDITCRYSPDAPRFTYNPQVPVIAGYLSKGERQ